jgi:hypothetical protein
MKNKNLESYFTPLKNTLNESKIYHMELKLIKDLFEYDIERLKSYIKTKNSGKINCSRNYIYACIKSTTFEDKRYEDSYCRWAGYRVISEEQFLKEFKERFQQMYPNQNAHYTTVYYEKNQFSTTPEYTLHKMSFDGWREELLDYSIIESYVKLIKNKTHLKVKEYSDEHKIVKSFLLGKMPLLEFEKYIESVEQKNSFMKYI